MATRTPRSDRRPSSRRQLASLVALAGAADAFLAWRLGLSTGLPAATYLVAVGAALAVVDRATLRLPNPIVLGSYPIEAALLVLASSMEGTWERLGRAGIGALALGGFFLAIALGLPGQLGMGDVKLAGLCGMGLAWWGWPTLATGVLAAWVLAALYTLARGVSGRRGTLAFAPFLLAGALVALGATR